MFGANNCGGGRAGELCNGDHCCYEPRNVCLVDRTSESVFEQDEEEAAAGVLRERANWAEASPLGQITHGVLSGTNIEQTSVRHSKAPGLLARLQAFTSS